MRYDFEISNTKYGYFVDDLVNGLFIFNDVSGMMDEVTSPNVEEQDGLTRMKAAHASTQYQRDRAKAYPSLQDQADMQFHDLANGTTTWLDAIQAVKDAYPKPV